MVVGGAVATAPAATAATAARTEPADLAAQLRNVLTSVDGQSGASPGGVTDISLAGAQPQAQAGGGTTLTADLEGAAGGATVAFQRLVPGAGDGTWATVGTAVADDDGRATSTVPVGGGAVASFRAVSPDPGAAASADSLPAGSAVSPLLSVPVATMAAPIVGGVTVQNWPSGQQVGSNATHEVVVTVTAKGGAPAAGVAVGLQYSADGTNWLPVGSPLRDNNATVPIEGKPTVVPILLPATTPTPVTDANGTAKAILVAPTSPGTVKFRAVAGINAAPSAASGAYGVVIDSDSLYNPPAISTSGADQVNTMPSRPGVLIKAQKLDPNGATEVDRPLQYPAVPASNPLDPTQPLVVPQVAGAGAPACVFRQNVRDSCVVGSTDGKGKALPAGQQADQYRILYSDKRFLINPPTKQAGGGFGYPDEASLGGESPIIEAASALVFVPKNAKADAKVVAWSHPTIGQEDHCSVTRGFNPIATVPGVVETPMPGGAQINAGDMSFFLEQTLAAGNIVVMPDYMGIGVNGPTKQKKTYLVGQQEGRDVLFGVKALQTAAGGAPGWNGINGTTWTGKDFAVIGHSQGGHAAMWTAVEHAKPWAAALDLNLKGVVAAAPASDIVKTVATQWQGYPGWVLGPELIQAFAFSTPAFAAFSLQNNVLSEDGLANLDRFTKYCTTQAFAASAALVPSGKNFLKDPSTNPQPYLNWAPAFEQQTPIIDRQPDGKGYQNSFPQDMPFLLISGTADNIVISQLNAAMQQAFCLVDETTGKEKVPMRAFWTPTMTGLNTPPASKFKGSIAGDVLTVDTLISGPGSQVRKVIYGALPTGATTIELENINNLRVGDQLLGWGADGPSTAPAQPTHVTAIDYAAASITVDHALSPTNANVYFKPDQTKVAPPLKVGTPVTYVTGASSPFTTATATISEQLTGAGFTGTYKLSAVSPAVTDGTSLQVQAFQTPPGGPSPVSNQQSPDHLNPLTFPFTQAEASVGTDAVSAYRVLDDNGTVALSFTDPIPAQFQVGVSFTTTGLPSQVPAKKNYKDTTADLNGTWKVASVNADSQSVTFAAGSGTVSPRPVKTAGWINIDPPGRATTANQYTYSNSPSELLTFTADVLADKPIQADCGEVDEERPTGLGANAEGKTWYSFPVIGGMADLAKYKELPAKPEFYQSWGSAALPPPAGAATPGGQVNPEPSLGLFFMPDNLLNLNRFQQSGCAFTWKPLQESDKRPANEACKQFGLWPYGQFLYATHDLDTGAWGTYPNDGLNPMIPAGVTPTPTPPGSVFTEVDPTRVYDSRTAAGPVAPGSPRTIDVTGGGAVDLPADVTAVAYNITATGQTASGYATVTPGNVDQEPATSTINWQRPNQTIANGYVVGVDANKRIKVFIGGTGTTQVIVDVVGYFAPEGEGSLFVPVSPARVNPSGTFLTGGQSATVDVVAGVPSVVPEDATGVAYNLTITGTTATGYLSVAPGAAAEAPKVSTINWSGPGITMANASQTGVDDGKVKVFAGGSGATKFFFDVVGYFVAPGDLPPGAYGSKFVPIDPVRAYSSITDTPGGPLTGNPASGALGAPRTTSVAAGGAVPVGATGVAYNLTITGNTGSGYVAVAPSAPPPATSNINWTAPKTTIANGTLGGVSELKMTSWAGGRDGTQYLIDIAGYFK